MKNIDKLILNILKLNPTQFHEQGHNTYYLLYKDITLCFWNMDRSIQNTNIGLVRINSGDAINISNEVKIAVINYIKKEETIDELLNRVNKDIRKNKLMSIENNIQNE